MKNILIIDDSEDFRETCGEILAGEGYQVACAPSPDDAFPLLKEHDFHLIICDLHMPFCSGQEQSNYKESFEVGVKTIKELKWALPSSNILALSAASASDLRKIAATLEPVPTLSKPRSKDELMLVVNWILSPESSKLVQ